MIFWQEYGIGYWSSDPQRNSDEIQESKEIAVKFVTVKKLR